MKQQHLLIFPILVALLGLPTWLVLLCFFLVPLISWYLDDHPLPNNDIHVTIMGAGYSGIGMGIKLKNLGINYTIYEKDSSPGGTWLVNTYPGCACDVTSHVYSYSFELKPDWTEQYPRQSELLDYIKGVVRKHDLNIQYNTKVDTVSWDAERNQHRIELHNGETVYSHFFIYAGGILREPITPMFPGVESFEGARFHSAEWDHSFDYKDKRTAIIGTGASAVQIVPAIASQVSQLTVFQRSACWAPSRWNFTFPQWFITLLRYVPCLLPLYRLFLFCVAESRIFTVFTNGAFPKFSQWLFDVEMRHMVKNNPGLAEKLIPKYKAGCKRITFSDNYISMFNRPNVSLVTAQIETFTPKGIRTADGEEREFDAIIYATGYSVAGSMLNAAQMVNSKGLSLKDQWGDEPVAYLGMLVENFTNFFMVLGPNTTLPHNSLIYMIECQANYIGDVLRHFIEHRYKTVTVKPSAVARFKRLINEMMPQTAYFKGCTNWYSTKSGYNYTLWPTWIARYWWLTRKINTDDYLFS